MHVYLHTCMYVSTYKLWFNFLLPIFCLNVNWYFSNFFPFLFHEFLLHPFFFWGCSFSHFTLTDAIFQRVSLLYFIGFLPFNFLMCCLTAQPISMLDYLKTFHSNSQSFECLWWNWTSPPHTFPMPSTELFIKALLFHISGWPWICSWKDFQRWYCLKP